MTEGHTNFIPGRPSAGPELESVVRLPVAPAMEATPPLTPDPATRAERENCGRLHYLALCVLYGGPPQGIEPFLTDIATEDGMDARLVALRPDPITPEAAAWLDAFEAGLDRWREGAFPETTSQRQGARSERPGSVTVAPFDQALHQACRRLIREDRQEGLRNLRALLAGRLPAKFDPDSETFAGRRKRPGRGG